MKSNCNISFLKTFDEEEGRENVMVQWLDLETRVNGLCLIHEEVESGLEVEHVFLAPPANWVRP